MVLSCCAQGCRERGIPGNKTTFHSFPKDEERRNLWCMNLRRENFQVGNFTKLCSKHFTPDCFDNEKFGGTWLKKDAIPTLFHYPAHLVPVRFEDGDHMEHQNLNLTPEPPVKRRHYIGDFSLEDMESPTIARDMYRLAKSQTVAQAKKIKDLQRKNKKLEKKTSNLEETVKNMRKKSISQCISEVSGTSSKEEGKTQPKASSTSIPTESSDPIPLEPSIEIKEEPIDYDPSPSTSNAGNEEFILPHPDDSWSTSNMVAPKVKVEPQCTFSVAGLSCPSVQDSTSESEHPSKKQKFDDAVKTSIEFEGLVPVDTPVSPVHNSNELSNPGTSNEHVKDEFDVFGEYIAVKLRNMDRRSVACTQKAISDIIFEAEMGKFLNQKQNTHY